MSLDQDITTLNRRFLLLVQKMDQEKHPSLAASVPSWLVESVRGMTLEQIDEFAEDMIFPCFYLSLSKTAFSHGQIIGKGLPRKAYLINAMACSAQRN